MSIFVLILRGLLPEVLSILQYFIKSPTTLADEIQILTAIRDALNVIIAGNTPPTPTS